MEEEIVGTEAGLELDTEGADSGESVEEGEHWSRRKRTGGGRSTRDIFARILAAMTFVLSCANSINSYTKDLSAKEISVSMHLDKAWDFLGGYEAAPFVPGSPPLTAVDRSRLEQALRHIDSALDLESRNSTALTYKAIYYTKREMYDEAVPLFEEVLRESPGEVLIFNGLGLISERRDEYETALNYYEKARVASPDAPVAYMNIGRLLAKLGRIEEAKSALEAGIAKDPAFAPNYQNLGAVYFQAEDEDSAFVFFERCLQVDPENLGCRKNFASVLRKRGISVEQISKRLAEFKDSASDWLH